MAVLHRYETINHAIAGSKLPLNRLIIPMMMQEGIPANSARVDSPITAPISHFHHKFIHSLNFMLLRQMTIPLLRYVDIAMIHKL